MDEVFGAADFSNVDDVGVAAKRAKEMDDDDGDHAEHEVVSKV